MRRVIGNLAWEEEIAGDVLAPESSLATMLSAVATVLRVFCRADDELWTPVAVDPCRLVGLEDLPPPRLVSGPLPTEAAGPVLAWGETTQTAALRVSGEVPLPRELTSWMDMPWAWPVADPDVACRVSHRQFDFELAQEWGMALPGAQMITSLDDLETHLAGGGAEGSPLLRWVLKAPFSSAGRRRVIGEGTAFEDWRRAERLLEQHGSLLFEPWMDREDDFGALGVVLDDGIDVLGTHGQEVQGQTGQFLSVTVHPRVGAQPSHWHGLQPEEQEQFCSLVERVGGALRQEGYRGPFGVDAYRHRGQDGVLHLHLLGEINTRMTMGLVTRALAERLAGSRDWPDSVQVKLCHGAKLPEESPRVLPLLCGDETEDLALWLEVSGDE